MGQALYRKYRSKNLSEIVGQEHITTTLANALKKGNVSHAYLFTGPRGVGKTSIARILAHEVNNLPYGDEATHLDIIEIDAASNRRIDEIRELREKVHNAPASAKYKVYIIDEVHMLTKEAFNALLKTLEEPPAHAIFILATTEAHKVPETIVSRTQRFSFKPIPKQAVINHLRSIAEQEKIDISDDALALIAEHGDGSFRDSISMLDQVKSGKSKVTLQDVQASLGIAPSETIDQLLAAIEHGEVAELLERLQAAKQGGYQAQQLASQLSSQLREKLLNGSSQHSFVEITHLLEQLLGVAASHNPQALLELVLLEATLQKQTTPPPKTRAEDTVTDLEVVEAEARPIADQPTDINASQSQAVLDAAVWQHALQAIKHKHNTLYGIARMAIPGFQGTELILRFKFPFHQKRLDEEKNRRLISDIIRKQTGLDVAITCIVDKDAEAPAPSEPEMSEDALNTISNIFGGGEVLES